MPKYKITLPQRFDGARYGLVFYKGEAITDNKIWADRLKARGNDVVEVADDIQILSAAGKVLGSGVSPGVTPPKVESNPAENDNPLEAMTNSQLRKYAAENDIDLSDVPNNKGELMVAIQKAIAEQKSSE